MTRRDVKLLNSLVNYVKDVKPYHTKLREFTSELFFQDRFNANLQDSLIWDLYQQNIWTRDSIGGYLLNKTVEGLESDRTFRIPAAIFPRFSLDDGMSINQTPPGDDTVLLDRTTTAGDIPDSAYPWPDSTTSSHFTGADQLPVKAHRSRLSYTFTGIVETLGTYNFNYDLTFTIDSSEETLFNFADLSVLVDNVVFPGAVRLGDTFTLTGLNRSFTPTVDDLANLALIGITPAASPLGAFAAFGMEKEPPSIEAYWTATSRYAVPFHTGSRVRVNNAEQIFKDEYVVDGSMSFIQFLPGFGPQDTDLIDVNLFKADRLFISYNVPFDFSPTPDTFTLTIDDTYPGRYQPVVFTNATPGTSKAAMDSIAIDVSATNGDVWQITAVGMWKFTVQKITPTLGPIEYASFKQPFDNGEIAFTIDRTWSDYYLTQDPNGYPTYDLDLYSFFPYSGTLEATNFFPSLETRTEHGVVVDPSPPNYAPVELVPFGKVKKKIEVTAFGDMDYYVFELNDIPARGAYVELRIEQNNQFNPRVHCAIEDQVNFTDLINFQETLCTNSQQFFGQYGSALLNPPIGAFFPGYAPWPPVPTVSWTPTPGFFPDFIWDLPLFDPVCVFTEEAGFDMFPYDDPPYDAETYYFAQILDDMYLTVDYQDDVPVPFEVTHNVHMHPEANFYQEPEDVHVLVMHHDRGVTPTSVVVYFMASILVDGVDYTKVIDEQRAIITMTTARSIAVKLSF